MISSKMKITQSMKSIKLIGDSNILLKNSLLIILFKNKKVHIFLSELPIKWGMVQGRVIFFEHFSSKTGEKDPIKTYWAAY